MPSSDHIRHRWLPLLMGLTALAAYSNTHSAPFLFDDFAAIRDNPTLAHIWPLPRLLSDDGTALTTVSGRPVLKASLALNVAISGTHVWSYHAANFLIHLTAGLLLFGLVNRTLRRYPPAHNLWNSQWPAAAVAALWVLHPIQTQAVTYIVQRAESLMGLFYLLTLYSFVRAHAGEVRERPVGAKPAGKTRIGATRRWQGISIAACLLGMGTKEAMATAPLLVLLYDRTFVAGSFSAAVRARRGFYLGLASTWLWLALLVAGTGGNRGGTVGIGVGIPSWAYPLTQFEALTQYLRLGLWPAPLVFEYGTFWAQSVGDVLPFAALVLPLLGLTGFALWRWPAWGFVGAWFFVILAPTSLSPGTVQMIVEHRMYLPLAAAMVAVTVALHSALGRHGWMVVLAWSGALALLTFQRNQTYLTEESIWRDTVAKRPDSPRAHASLAHVFARQEQWSQAVAGYQDALRLRPDFADAHHDYANVLGHVGRQDEALVHYRTAHTLKPGDPVIGQSLGSALAAAGRIDEALQTLRAVAERSPHHVPARIQLSEILLAAGRPGEALSHLEHAQRVSPGSIEVLTCRGAVLLALGKSAEALLELEKAVERGPGLITSRLHYADALMQTGAPERAADHYWAAANLRPDIPELFYNAGNAWLHAGRLEQAIGAYQATLRVRPGWAAAHHNLALALLRAGRPAEAVPHFEETLRHMPKSAEAHHHLALALEAAGRLDEAIRQNERALVIEPGFRPALQHLLKLRRR
jgi:protein O-mannosyl-transferase